MDKNAIKNFAIWARNKLIADSVYKASLLGISEKGIGNPLPQSTADAQLFDIGMKEPYAITGQEISQRKKLVDAIKSKERDLKYQEAFQNVMEEVAYTWFNRLIAIRFMEVNDYMPSHIRVLSSENPSKAEPDLVTTPFDSDLSFSEKEKQQIIDWKNENKIDDVFRMLFIKQCNALNDPLPMLFEKISDYTELLLNVSVTDREGIVWHLVHDIPEDNFNVNAIGDDGQPVGQVEIIGWLYQYYNTEPKDQVFANLKKNIKITKETIPAATQLFTPDWIVRYMVENSLGRLWVEGHPNDELKSNWKYYLDEAKQEEDVQKQLDQIYAEHAKLKPEDITCMDPCCGSGHILVYMFEVLEQIYQSQGYSAREAAASIVEHNIYGLDIDKRAAQLAYFAVMMKARQYDRRFLARGIQPHVYAICESNSISEDCLQYFANGDKDLNREIHVLKAYMEDACEYGSLIQIPSINFAEINKRIVEIECEVDLYKQEVEDSLVPAIKCAEILSNKYQIVVTNPPYMGIGNISNKLYSYIVDRYKDFKQDIYCAFIKACSNMNSRNGIFAMITQQSFMTNSRFLATRKYITTEMYFINMAYIGTKGFDEIGGEKVRTCSFAARRRCLNDYQAYYIDLQNENCEAEKSERFHECKLQINSNNNGESIYKVGFSQYLKFSDLSFSFWVSNNIANISNSTGITIESIGNTRHGLVTGNGDRFMRFWYECPITNLAINNNNTNTTSLKWFPYSKGGTFRRWYGNREYVVNWENDGLEIRNYYVKGSIKSSNYNLEYNFKPSITWSDVRSGKFSARFTPEGALFDTSGPSLFLRNTEDIWWVLGLLNSDVTQKFLDVSCTGLHYTTGAVSNIPIQIVSTSQKNSIGDLVKRACEIAAKDWNNSEISWQFTRHPLCIVESSVTASSPNERGPYKLVSIYENWSRDCVREHDILNSIENKLNEKIIDIYGLQNEFSSEGISEESVKIAEPNSDIKSLISYAVGCMFGRYSLDVDGLAYAGGEWDDSKYKTFIPDADNVIPVTDEEYLDDDIVGRFVKFVKVVYGEKTLEENLSFIAEALGGKGKSSREVIRNYFLKDFFKDHCKTYQKRPIYWLYDSGKQNGFKALVYLHRMDENTTGKVRADYLHRMEQIYANEVSRMQDVIEHSKSAHEVSVAEKRMDKLKKQIKECQDYDAKLGHLALDQIKLNLDDGVKVNYRKAQTGRDGKFYEVLADSKNIMANDSLWKEYMTEWPHEDE